MCSFCSNIPILASEINIHRLKLMKFYSCLNWKLILWKLLFYEQQKDNLGKRFFEAKIAFLCENALSIFSPLEQETTFYFCMNYDVQLFSFSTSFFLDLNYILSDIIWYVTYMIYNLNYENANSPQMSLTNVYMTLDLHYTLHRNQNRQALLAELQLVKILLLKSGPGQENMYAFYVKPKNYFHSNSKI